MSNQVHPAVQTWLSSRYPYHEGRKRAPVPNELARPVRVHIIDSMLHHYSRLAAIELGKDSALKRVPPWKSEASARRSPPTTSQSLLSSRQRLFLRLQALDHVLSANNALAP